MQQLLAVYIEFRLEISHLKKDSILWTHPNRIYLIFWIWIALAIFKRELPIKGLLFLLLLLLFKASFLFKKLLTYNWSLKSLLDCFNSTKYFKLDFVNEVVV